MHPYLLYRNYLTPVLPYTGRNRGQSKLADALRRSAQAMARRWKRRKMIAALEAMDDRLLRDIGLHRGQIREMVDRFDDRELRMRLPARAVACPAE
ncbi:MAG: DUF1127 domain-containing protein [Rhodobacteraceae bacterium]|nr:DUF1127 domain-containing protein [Paracoccaceae bacterium]